jgi:hypothetical protein
MTQNANISISCFLRFCKKIIQTYLGPQNDRLNLSFEKKGQKWLKNGNWGGYDRQ